MMSSGADDRPFAAFSAALGRQLDRADSEVWSRSDSLVDDLALDSLALWEVIAFVEARDGVVFPDELIESIRTVGDLYEWTLSASGAGHPGALERDSIEPQFTGRHTRLRQLEPADYAFLFELSREPRNLIAWRDRGVTHRPEQFADHLWSGVTAQFVVERLADGEALGLVSCYQADLANGHAHLSVLFSTGDPSGLGWRLEGVALFLLYLFDTFPLRKIYAQVPAFNLPMLESGVGRIFQSELILPDYDYVANRWWDMHVLSIGGTEARAIVGELLRGVIAAGSGATLG